MLVAEGAELKRLDLRTAVWQGPPPGAVGWWKSQVPDRRTARSRGAPNEVLLGFFDDLASEPQRQDMRYVLALLLVRRRVFRLEDQRAGRGRPRDAWSCTVPGGMRPTRSWPSPPTPRGPRRSSRNWPGCWKDEAAGGFAREPNL